MDPVASLINLCQVGGRRRIRMSGAATVKRQKQLEFTRRVGPDDERLISAIGELEKLQTAGADPGLVEARKQVNSYNKELGDQRAAVVELLDELGFGIAKIKQPTDLICGEEVIVEMRVKVSEDRKVEGSKKLKLGKARKLTAGEA